jgi:predicted nucleotidyltransferase
MKISSKEEIVEYLKRNKGFLYDKYGVTRMGIFGSFIRDEQTRSSDIDMVVEIEKSRKNIHSFLQLKRFLEKELARKIDLGFEHSLKPMVREKIKGQIIYV